MKTAILIIDVYQSIEDGVLGHYEYGDLRLGIDRIEEVLKTGEEFQCPIYAATYKHQPLSRRLMRYVKPGNVFNKKEYNAFEQSSLDERLRHDRTDTIIVMGFNRDRCVKQTIQGAVERGYNIIACEELMFEIECDDIREKTLEYFKNQRGVLFFEQHTKVLEYLKTA